CLPEMKTGDSWLFSLDRSRESNELILNYGSRSGPVTEERKQIALLRRLASLDAEGIVKGHAYSVEETDKAWQDFPSQNQTILLTRVEDSRTFKALTDDKGDYEFEPLPAGEYDLDPNTRPGVWTMWSGKIDVKAHGCIESDLDFKVDGQIAGRLVFPADVDPDAWEVEVSPVDDPGVVPDSAWTDKSGQFVLHGLEPGKYVLAFKKTEKREGPNLKVDLFAPGTNNRANAQIIEVGKAKRVEGLELIVPRSALE
ncbi:MAG: carboxypeptidase regulatory-like domain-containing protein, partial [Terracidiphilus sp.]